MTSSGGHCKLGHACLCTVRESFKCPEWSDTAPSPEHLQRQRDHWARIDARRTPAVLREDET